MKRTKIKSGNQRGGPWWEYLFVSHLRMCLGEYAEGVVAKKK
jgi:hypothetical protein